MKRFSQIVCVFLIAATILSISVSAAEQASNFFGSHSSYILELSDSEFQVWFHVTAVEGMDVLGVSEVKVQKSSDRVNWETVKTYSGRYGYDTSTYDGYVTYSSAESGFYYRAKITYYAENDRGNAEYVDYTSYV